jgi:hypothetical protein
MQPLRAKQKQHEQIAQTASLPAPTNGWYVGDNQATPPEKTAIIMNNAFPQLDYVRPRRGSQPWASGCGGPITSLLPWTTGVTSRLFAVANGGIFDASSAGPVGAPAVTGLGSSYMVYTQFAGFGQTYLVAVNGVDPVQIFDGVGWNRTYPATGTLTSGSPDITGLSPTTNLQNFMAVSGTGVPPGSTISGLSGSTATLSANATASGAQTLTFYQNAPITGYPGTGFSYVWSYKGRLYFVDDHTRDVYYLGLGAIGGPATLLPLTAFFKFGGYIIAGGTWAIDSTSGAFQAWVCISSEGEVLMYNGDYPGAVNWAQLGAYKCSRPLGPLCLMPAGGDLVVMTEDGVVAMSKVMTLDQIALENVAVTKPIAPAWRSAVLARNGLPGWQILPWPLESMAVVNLPKTSQSDFTQFIANARTGAWAQYLGYDANCFAVFQDNLYYGDSLGTVMQAETGGSDAGLNNYTTSILMGFSTLGAATSLKQVRMVKPYVLATAPTAPQVSIAVDYNVGLPQAPAPSNVASGALWDVAKWDQAVWGGGLTSQTAWMDAQGLGTAIAICYQLTTGSGTVAPDIRIAAFDILFEPGGIGLG